jgi:hypothetical protein
VALEGSGQQVGELIRIGHSLIALVLARLGGQLSRWLFVGNRKPEAGSDKSGKHDPR